MALRTYLEAMDNDHAEFTAALEYKLFMPYGSYKIETKDETWIMRFDTQPVTCSSDSFRANGLFILFMSCGLSCLHMTQ